MPLDQNDTKLLHDVTASIVVPAHPIAPPAEILSRHSGVKERTTFFYDESLKILVLLDCPACPEQRLEKILQRLEIRVDAWALTSRDGDEKSPSEGGTTRDLIASESVIKADDPVTLVKQDDQTDGIRLQLVWELHLTLGRPRVRSPDQKVVFVPVATVIDKDLDDDQEEFLEPFTLLEPNLFQPLGALPGAANPYLPLSRSERVAPPPQKDNRIRLKHQSTEPIRAFAAIMPRLKYNKIHTLPAVPKTIASLDIEMNPFEDLRGRIEEIEVSMTNGTVASLMPDPLPIPCQSKDCVTFLYDLQSTRKSGTNIPLEQTNIHTSSSSNQSVDVLSVRIVVSLFIDSTTTAIITTSWTSNIDVSLALNPAFGTPSQTLQRTNRPTSLNFAPYPDPGKSQARDRSSVGGVRTASTSLQHQVIPTSIPRQSPSAGLSISFEAPDEPVHVGVPFTWRVLIVNNTRTSAKLAIVPLPRIQRPTNPNQHFAKRYAPKASSTSIIPLTAISTTKQHSRSTTNPHNTAKAVVDEHVLYALHHQSPMAGATAVPPETDLMSLTAELRIGPLSQRACHEAEIKFIACKTGTLTIEAMRVVDLTREGEGGVGVISDIRELPEIVVVEG
ncbi:hypothetical protein LTR64_007002 [Lithohypha guttulata]|uniref:uncharacterized protein n=1 Tax=Lithohypha guttulata TaxID=1690604 RepID=UPI002DE1BE35|nr:hypothetical protein LTR51_004440 [Lithohypha guttulata]